MPELPSGTSTFLFTGIEGGTALWEVEPEAAHLAAVRHDEIERHGGVLVSPRGRR